MKEVLLFSVFLLVSYGISTFLSGHVAPSEEIRNQLRRQVSNRSTRPQLQSESIVAEEPRGSQIKKLLMSSLDRQLSGKRIAADVATRLRRADVKLQVSEFLLLCAASALGLTGVSFLLKVGPQFRLAAFMLGVWIPFVVVESKHARRLRAFDSQLSDCLTLLANSLRSGYSLHQAIDVVSKEMPPPLSREFAQVMRESKLNISLEDSLRNLALRVPSADLDLVVTAVLIQRQVGGNLGDVLDAINGTIRDRIRITGEIRTLTAEGRISGWIVGAMPFGIAFFIFMFNPGYLVPLFNHPLGLTLVGVGFIMQILGLTVVRKIVDIEV